MKFTLSWLHDHLATKAQISEIADTLTRIGLEVESITEPGRQLDGFCVGYVEDVFRHPNADRLQICEVDTGKAILRVVCGAPNARRGMKGIFVPPGHYIPGSDMHLRASTIRGVESFGMLCSEYELALGDNHDTIIEIQDDAPTGLAASKALGLDDPVIDIAVTPNRPDALGVRGIARDLAACGLGRLKPISLPQIAGSFTSPIGLSLQLREENADACAVFSGRFLRNLTNSPAPDWLQKRLRATGLRPISALVDITNYLCLDLARPLHIFDADKITGAIHVRLACSGEKLLALDGKEYALDQTMTVVCDDSGPLAIGGIIGGAASGCSYDTQNIFLESAWFSPYRSAQTGRKLNILSEARRRFERGVDPAMVVAGGDIAAKMVLDFCGGEASLPLLAGKSPKHDRQIFLPKSEVQKRAGATINAKEQSRILKALGMELEENEAHFSCHPPSWRPDIHDKADLVEEVCRIHGFDKLPLSRFCQTILSQNRFVHAPKANHGCKALSCRARHE